MLDPSAATPCLCAERGLLGVHEEPCAGFGTRSDELCEQAEREATADGWVYTEEAIVKGEPLQVHETILVRGRVYRVAGFNAYGDAMLSEVRT